MQKIYESRTQMQIKEAKKITGGLSAPGKMPEGSYNLPAAACQTGAKLREVPDTPCHKCYAFKGRYNFPNVKAALARRLKSLTHPQWVEAMTTLVKKKKGPGATSHKPQARHN